ncbi:Phosphotransferase system, phosphoenolpyruvate-dependent unit, putative fragment [Alteracholeplasma palmae J233]|uniref:Phosphotransferase system, phosphoenolpyruvate-dependent unit, putative n=1 Tax=Alteracholeplasma palmae (strain ATCC 49389 / J233) TaxID=1318466 RepID=U4KKN4_ALTPJ|nr:fructose PTS transporter subunit IIA [Alteracholeplasma palmae]CCV64183.1 Phosphotransferase system, phosphoenolpyruvate-dependent unit, putative fragment [Alteracholeplasma palmae J233]
MKNDLISKDTIFLDLVVKTKDELFLMMSEELFKLNKIESKEAFYESLKQRESIITTGIGDGIGIPHAKDKTVYHPFVAFIKIENGIEYEALDKKKVDLVFMLAVSENSERLHLEILANLSRHLLNEGFIKRLRNSSTVEETYEVLKEIESEVNFKK